MEEARIPKVRRWLNSRGSFNMVRVVYLHEGVLETLGRVVAQGFIWVTYGCTGVFCRFGFRGLESNIGKICVEFSCEYYHYFLGFGVPYFNTFSLKEPLRNKSLYFFAPWLLNSPVKQHWLWWIFVNTHYIHLTLCVRCIASLHLT